MISLLLHLFSPGLMAVEDESFSEMEKTIKPGARLFLSVIIPLAIVAIVATFPFRRK